MIQKVATIYKIPKSGIENHLQQQQLHYINYFDVKKNMYKEKHLSVPNIYVCKFSLFLYANGKPMLSGYFIMEYKRSWGK